MSLIPKINDEDWKTLRQALQKLSGIRLGPQSSPTFGGLSVEGTASISNLIVEGNASISGTLTMSALLASRILSLDANGNLESVATLTAWIEGTANQITVTDDTDGTVTLATPQDINTTSDVTFGDLTLGSPSNIYALSHDSFADFAALEHVDHSGVLVNASAPITGGGSISISRDIGLAYTSTLSLSTNALHVDDSTLSHDNLDGVHQSVLTNATPEFADLVLESPSTIYDTLDHDSLLNVDANQHIDHTTVIISAEAPLAQTNDDIASNIALKLAYTSTLSLSTSYLHVDVAALSHDSLDGVHQSVVTTATPTLKSLVLTSAAYIASRVGVAITAPHEIMEVVCSAASGTRFIISDGAGANRREFLIQPPTSGADYARFLAYNRGSSAYTDLSLEAGYIKNYVQAGKGLGVSHGLGQAVDALLHVETTSSEGKEAVKIEQTDADQAFVNFQGTALASSTTNNIALLTAGAVEGYIKIKVNGDDKWIPYCASISS